MTRSILLAASIASAVVATVLAFGIYHHNATPAELNRICLGWIAWSIALAGAAALPLWRNR